jgi:hypothetical protein
MRANAALAAALFGPLLAGCAAPAPAPESKPEPAPVVVAAPVPAPIQEPAPAPVAAPVQVAAPAPVAAPAAPPSAKDEELKKLTDDMLARIGEIRKLKMKTPVERRWTTREAMKVDLKKQLDEEMPPEKAAEYGRSLQFFGLLAEGVDLRDMFTDAMASGVAGYYLPDKKVFFLVEGFNADGSRPIVFHELTHAVEDQYYDYFDQMKKWGDADQSDRANAIRAVVEGSAQMFTQKFFDSEPGLEDRFFTAMMTEAQESGAIAAQEKIPPFFAMEMQFFPYHNGSRFLNRVLPKLPAPAEGEDAMAVLYRDPPTSSEMILHPEKYLGERDLPQDVTIPALEGALGEGWKKDFENTMGELDTGILLNAYLVNSSIQAQVMSVAQPPEGGFRKQADILKISIAFRGRTATGSAGWDGDRYAMYSSGQMLCLGWATTWDTEKDAQEFAEIYGAVVEKKYGIAKAEPGADVPGDIAVGEWKGRRWRGTRGGDTAIVANGLRVLVAERVPAERLEKFVEALAGATFTRDEKDVLPVR